jgi:two-component system response regulator AtoC
MVAHSWPGNIRELENRIKRFVILRDESALVDFRNDRPQTSVPVPAPAPAAPVADVPAAAAAAAPIAAAERPDHGAHQAATEPPAAPEKPGRLPDVSRAAAMIAERRAIQDALDRVRWNRTKAAQMLGVSYKTLLSKMKECGISAPAGAEEL